MRLHTELTIGLDDLADTSVTNLLALQTPARTHLRLQTTQRAIAPLVQLVENGKETPDLPEDRLSCS